MADSSDLQNFADHTAIDPYAVHLSGDGVEIRKLPEQQLAVDYEGDFLDAYTWHDNNGDNILILSREIEEREDKDAGRTVRTSELFVYQYARKKEETTPRLLWRVYDSGKECPFDLVMDFLGEEPYISDIDEDGITETTIVYKTACRSDASPARMEVIMHEGGKKYALGGCMMLPSVSGADSVKHWIATAEDKGLKGTGWGFYESDKDFASAPEFLEFAEDIWKENVFEDLPVEE